MAVVQNSSSESGDVFLIRATIPVFGLQSLTGFIDSVVGETATRFWTKEFKYSTDGINFSPEWEELTVGNLTAIQVEPNDPFTIEYRYTRTGGDNSGLLEWNFTEIQGVFTSMSCGVNWNSSIFSYFFDSCMDAQRLEWCLNVLEKLYKPGIVPTYITRGDECNRNGEDDDYLDFWRSITCFWAMIVYYAREWERFQFRQELLVNFLTQRGMFVCSKQDIVDLTYIMNNYYDEIRHRGTQQIAIKKGTDVNGTAKPVDGELLRLICYNEKCDEFLFSVSEFDKIGWVVDKWSPMYRGAMPNHQLIKAWEQTNGEVQDLSKYPLVNSGNVSIVNDAGVGFDVMEIAGVANGQRAGIGATTVNVPNFADGLPVNKDLTYEFSFWIKADAGVKIDVNLYGMNEAGVSNQMKNATLPSFITTPTVFGFREMVRDDVYYFFRTIIHPSDYVWSDSRTASHGDISFDDAYNAKMGDGICRILPEVVLNNTTGTGGGTVRLYGVRFGLAQTPYSTGFVGTTNFIQTFLLNNAAQYTELQLSDIIKRFLIPYDATLQLNTLS